MARITFITFAPDAPPKRVMSKVRETLESRDYLWEETGPLAAVVSEHGRPPKNPAISRRLRMDIRVDVATHRLVLTREVIGAAYTDTGGAWTFIWLTIRFRRMVKAVRDDLAAAALR